MAFGMIALTTFIIYNCLFSMGLSQPTNTAYASFQPIPQTAIPSSPGVFMHVFIDDKEENLYKYITYVEVFAHKYKDFTYNLIIVANDTSDETNNLTAETNNVVALNSLWANDANDGYLAPRYSNVKVKYITLSKYLNDSPIKKYWKNLPQQLIQFLVRAISVWDKGGIAVNPIILTPRSPDAAYMEKFITTIKNFKKYKTKKAPEKEQDALIKKHSKISRKVNNIRDIINALEPRDVAYSASEETLHAVESRNDLIVIDAENKLVPVTGIDLTIDDKHTNILTRKAKPLGKLIDSNLTSTTQALNQEKNTSKDVEKSENSSNLLPQFLNYLFHNTKMRRWNDTTHSMRKRRSPTINEVAIDVNKTDLQMEKFGNSESYDNNMPIIVSANGIPNNSAKPTYQDDDKLYALAVDLKGNIIATNTPCHAFIGNMFTNAIHHNKAESLTDFINKELSIFCKGSLLSCLEIDVILV